MNFQISGYQTALTNYYAALLPSRGPHYASHSVCPSVCPSVPLSLPSVTSRHLANYNDTHMYFSARAEGRISYGHLGRTDSCFIINSGAVSLPKKHRMWTIWDGIWLMCEFESSSGTECYWWWHWSVAQTSPCLHSSQRRTFWIFTVTQIMKNISNCNKLSYNLLLNEPFASHCR